MTFDEGFTKILRDDHECAEALDKLHALILAAAELEKFPFLQFHALLIQGAIFEAWDAFDQHDRRAKKFQDNFYAGRLFENEN